MERIPYGRSTGGTLKVRDCRWKPERRASDKIESPLEVLVPFVGTSTWSLTTGEMLWTSPLNRNAVILVIGMLSFWSTSLIRTLEEYSIRTRPTSARNRWTIICFIDKWKIIISFAVEKTVDPHGEGQRLRISRCGLWSSGVRLQGLHQAIIYYINEINIFYILFHCHTHTSFLLSLLRTGSLDCCDWLGRGQLQIILL